MELLLSEKCDEAEIKIKTQEKRKNIRQKKFLDENLFV